MRPADYTVKFVDKDTGDEYEIPMQNFMINRDPNTGFFEIEIQARGRPNKIKAKLQAPPAWVHHMVGGGGGGGSNPRSQNLGGMGGSGRIEMDYSLDKKAEKKAPICECGKEKHGFAGHAGWCDIKN